MKVKEIKKMMFEMYANELIDMVDMEEMIKKEIEEKAIVVIDEIDKLVRSVSLISYKINLFRVMHKCHHQKQAMKEFNMIFFLCWTAQL